MMAALRCIVPLTILSVASGFSIDSPKPFEAGHDVNRRLFLNDAAANLGLSTLAISTPFAVGATAVVASPPAASAATVQSKIPEWTLDNGVRFPVLALNTVGLSAEDATRAVGFALECGITHVDFHPGKERDGVAAFLKEGGPAARKKLFLNTKIRKAPPGTSPEDAAENARRQIEEDLSILGVKGVDMLMLRDSPDCEVIQAQWAVLEDALKMGKTRSIGVINFCEKAMKCVLQTAKVKPALNYYMLHVGMGPDPRGLRSFCESQGIRTFAYGAVGEPGPNQELVGSQSVLKKIGQAHGRQPEEVALRWVLQQGAGCSVRPTVQFGLGTSVCPDDGVCREGLLARAGAFDWKLTSQEMDELNSLTAPNDNPTLFSSSGCPDAFVMPKK